MASSKANLQIRLFGPFDVQIDGAPLPPLRTRKDAWLLALLILRHGRPVDRVWLAGTLWPDSDHTESLRNLRNSLHELRRALGVQRDRLESPTATTLRLELAEAHVDLLEYDAAISRGDTEALVLAVQLYAGVLLEGCTEEWVFQERAVREASYLRSLETLAQKALDRHDQAQCISYLERLLTIDPLEEGAVRQLMTAQVRSGNYAAAVMSYRNLRLKLREAVNAAPDPETVALYKRLRADVRRRGAEAATAPQPPTSERPSRQAGLTVNGNVEAAAKSVAPPPSEPVLPPTPIPTGTVTFLFTDIEGSTRLWEAHPDAMRAAVARHDTLMRQAIERHDGHVFKTIGDAFCAAFPDASQALSAALASQLALAVEPWAEPIRIRVRMALHTGVAEVRDNDYFGQCVNRVARLLAIGHGGQTLISGTTQELLREELPNGVTLQYRGSHRLRDLQRPETVFQLLHPELPAEFPPLRSLSAHPNNLPQQVTSFVGREKELEEVTALLVTSRLVTLTGMGGVGKTRLSLAAAESVAEFYRDGVYVVELAGIPDYRDVPAAVALALGLKAAGGVELPTAICEMLRSRQTLLVLDNFEQVVEAAGFVALLLQNCAQLTCLVTSRHLLQIAGEREFAVEPLPLPVSDNDMNALQQCSSVRLFLERGQTAHANFQLSAANAPAITEICRRLEGLPLAVELTAALLRGMTPQQILPRLQDRFRLLASSQRDLPPRQRSLRGAIDWSYDLLTPEEQRLFAEVSVFVGSFSIEAAEYVCTLDNALELLFSLRDKSLLKPVETNDEMRYSLLEMLRDYARDKRSGMEREAEIRDRHAEYYLGRLQEWDAKRFTGGLEGEQARNAIAAELPNIRAGMDWAVERGDHGRVIAYGSALFWFLCGRGLYDEAETRLTVAEKSARSSGDTAGLAVLLNRHGVIAWDRAEYAAAREWFQESYDLSRAIDDQNQMFWTLSSLGNVAWAQMEYPEAQRLWEEALKLAIATEQPAREAMLRANLGNLAVDRGDFATAERHLAASLELDRRNQRQRGIAYTLSHMAQLHYYQGRYCEALERMEEAQPIFADLDSQHEIAWSLALTGRVLLATGRVAEAKSRAQEGLEIAQKHRIRRSEVEALEVLAGAAAQEEDWTLSDILFRRGYEIARQTRARRSMLDLLHDHGRRQHRRGYVERAYLMLSLAAQGYGDVCGAIGQAAAIQRDDVRATLTSEQIQRLDTTLAALTLDTALDCLKVED